jgi:D-alanine-D-alanine ligase
MNIGIAYDLRSEYLAMGYSEEETAEFDKDDTIEAIANGLRDNGFAAERIGNVFSCVKHLAAGERWDMVFNITEGLHGYSREAQVPALLDAYDIPYTFSDPLILTVALHKATAKRVVQTLGVPTPAFAVIHSVEQADGVNLPFPLFAKPMAEGTSRGITEKSFITSKKQLRDVCAALLERYHQPVLVETYLSGREVTVGITGTGADARCAGVLEVVARESAEAHAYSYENKERCEELVDYRLATDTQANSAAELALAVWRGLGCRDAGRVDFRADQDGKMQFLEVNPLAGLHPTHSDLPIMWQKGGRSYVDLIGLVMTSACRRHDLPLPPECRTSTK